MTCTVEGCDTEKVEAKGLCLKHYGRMRRNGCTDDPKHARGSLEFRFWRKVDKRGPDDCWIWTGTLSHGYGSIGLGKGKQESSHRVSWMFVNGPIPKMKGHHGAVIMHTCDNRLCVNPAHLALGTQKDNVRDMDAKERRVTGVKIGSDNNRSKFTEAQVRYIRACDAPAPELARAYGCHRNAIYAVRKRQVWKHVD